MSDWTRGDDPVYDGYRENWKAQAEADYEAECAEEEERHDIVVGISTARLRELADAEREGRIVVYEYPNCYACPKLPKSNLWQNNEPCKSCHDRALAAADAGKGENG